MTLVTDQNGFQTMLQPDAPGGPALGRLLDQLRADSR